MDTKHGADGPTLAAVTPSTMGVDGAALAAAVALAQASEPPHPRAMDGWLRETLAGEPWPRVMGPIADRGAPSGVVVVGGREVARWGAPERRDMAFSIAKSVLATVAGTAHDDGLLPDLDEPAVLRAPIDALGGDVHTGALDPVSWSAAPEPARVPEGSVPDPHPTPDLDAARTITWRQLLTQTSDWRGTLFGVPWWADPQGRQPPDAPPYGPGARFSYNDVRTNLCSLALTHLIGASNAETLGARIFGPIGVPDGWSWRGLHPMRTTVRRSGGPPREVPVTTGGSHWGGGLWLTAFDLARYGLLHLYRGAWGARRLLSATWCDALLAPTAVRAPYGLMWWRNPEAGTTGGSPAGTVAGDDDFYPGAGVRGFAAHGTGEQVVWCDPDRDLVAVVRWTTAVESVLAAITDAVPVVGASA